MTNDPIDLLKRVVGDSQLKADPEAYLKKHKGNYTEALRSIAKDNGLEIDADQERAMHEAYKLPVINRAYFEENWKSDKEIAALEARGNEIFEKIYKAKAGTLDTKSPLSLYGTGGVKKPASLNEADAAYSAELNTINETLRKNQDLRDFGFNKIEKPAFGQRDLAGVKRDIKDKKLEAAGPVINEEDRPRMESEMDEKEYARYKGTEEARARIKKEADEMELALINEKEDPPVVVSYPTAAKNAAVEVGGSTKNQWVRALGIMKEADYKLTRQTEMAAEAFEADPTEENKAKLDVLIAHGKEQRRQFSMGFGVEETIRNEEEKYRKVAESVYKNESWLDKAGVTAKSAIGRLWHTTLGKGFDDFMGRFNGESLDDFLDRREEQGKAAAPYQSPPGFSGGAIQRYVDVEGQRFHVDQHGDIISPVDNDMNLLDLSDPTKQKALNALADTYNKNKDKYKVQNDFSGSRLFGSGVELVINMLPIIAGTMGTSMIPGVGQLGAVRSGAAFISGFATMFGDDFERSLQAGRGFDHAWNTGVLSSGIKSVFETFGGVEARMGKQLGEGVKDLLIKNTETLVKKYGTQNLPKKFWNEWWGMVKKELPPETVTELAQDFSDAYIDHAVNGMALEIDPLDEVNMVLSMPFGVGGFGLVTTYFKTKKDKDVWKRSYIAAVRSGKQIETVFDESVKEGKLTEEDKGLKVASLNRERDQVSKIVGNLSITDKQVDKVLDMVAEKAMNLEFAAGTKNPVKAEKFRAEADKIQEKIDKVILEYSQQPERIENVRDNYLFNKDYEEGEFDRNINQETPTDGEGQQGDPADAGASTGQPGVATTNTTGTQSSPVPQAVPAGEQLPVLGQTTKVVPYEPRVTFYGVMGDNAVVKNEKGESGVIKVDDGGKVTVEYEGRIEELGNIEELSDETLQDHGLTVEDASAVANRTYKVGSDLFISDNLDNAIEYDAEGNVSSVTLMKVKKGSASETQKFEGQQAENLAYQITLDKFSNLQSNEGIRTIEALIPEKAGSVPETIPEGKAKTPQPSNAKPAGKAEPVRQKIATAKVVVDGKVKSIKVIVLDIKKTEAEILEMADNGEITHLEALAILQSAFKKNYTNQELNDIVAKSLEKKEESGIVETNLEELEHNAEEERDAALSSAEERREDGEFKEDGITYKRNEPSEGIKGKSGEVRFASGVVVPFTYKLVEADNVQPSHQGGVINKGYFIPEGQPKPRTGDDSINAENGFADNPRFNELGHNTNAYSGAPVTNERDEVIQGHNRASGLKKGYVQGNGKYKSDLINNADKFGYTKEQVEGMTNPMLVREVKASDEKAIELGNYDVKDLETGGKRRVDPVATSRRIPYDIKAKILKLLFSGSEDTTTTQKIRDTQNNVVKLVFPFLNETQRAALVNKEGKLTGTGVEDIASLVEYFMFDGGHISLPELFDALSHTQKEGLKKAIPFIYSVPIGKGLLHELQAAIIALNVFKSSGLEFNNWLAAADIFNEGMTPVDKYSPAELALVKKLDEAKSQSEIKNIFSEYAKLVNGTDKDMFSEAVKGLSKKEAIKQQFNVTYNERQNKKQNKSGGQVASGQAKTDTNEKPAAPAKAQEEVGLDESAKRKKSKEEFDKISGVKTTLVGSTARNEAKETSDIDIVLEGMPIQGKDKLNSEERAKNSNYAYDTLKHLAENGTITEFELLPNGFGLSFKFNGHTFQVVPNPSAKSPAKAQEEVKEKPKYRWNNKDKVWEEIKPEKPAPVEQQAEQEEGDRISSFNVGDVIERSGKKYKILGNSNRKNEGVVKLEAISDDPRVNGTVSEWNAENNGGFTKVDKASTPIEVMREIAAKRPDLKEMFDEAEAVYKEMYAIWEKSGKSENLFTGPSAKNQLPFPYRLQTALFSGKRTTDERRAELIDEFKKEIEDGKKYLKNPHSDKELSEMKKVKEEKEVEKQKTSEKAIEDAKQRKEKVDKIKQEKADFIKSFGRPWDGPYIAIKLSEGVSEENIAKTIKVIEVFEDIDGKRVPYSQIDKALARYNYDLGAFAYSIRMASPGTLEVSAKATEVEKRLKELTKAGSVGVWKDVFHGTNNYFTEFKAGPKRKLGTFFFVNRGQAEKRGNRVIKARIKADKTYTLDAVRWLAMSDKDAIKLRDKLIEDGYDSVYIPPTDLLDDMYTEGVWVALDTNGIEIETPQVGSGVGGDVERNWKVQGRTISNSKVGEKISESDAKKIIKQIVEHPLNKYDNLQLNYNKENGTISFFGDKDLVNSINEDIGNKSVQKIKIQQETDAINKAKAEKESYQTDYIKSKKSESDWIDNTFGKDAIGNFNKIELIKYLSGESDKFGGSPNRKMQEGLEKIGAIKDGNINFKQIKKAFEQSLSKQESVDKASNVVVEAGSVGVGGDVKPIRQLGTGANVYFETEKHRVNDNLKNGKVLLNIGSKESEIPMANIEFDSATEAVNIAKELNRIYPKGVPDAVLIDKVVENIKVAQSLKPEAKKEQSKTEPLPAPDKKAARKIRDEALRAQADEAFKAFRKSLGKNLSSGGLDKDSLEKGIELIGIYIKSGVYKFSDIVEDAVEEFGDVVKEMFNALKVAYTAYYGAATDEEAEKMDVASARKSKFEDIIKTKTDESKTETGTGGAGLDRVPEGVQPGLFQGADQEGDVGGASNEGSGAVQQDGGGTKGQPRLRPGRGRGGGKNVSVSGTKSVEVDLFSPEADRLSSDLFVSKDEPPIIVGTILPSPAPLSNYVPDKEEDTAKSFSKTKHFAKNLKAIKALLAIVKDGDRLATAEEKEMLSDYVGWGGIKAVNRIAGSKLWSNSDLPFKGMYEELVVLIKEFEDLGYVGLMKDISRSTLNAHYTSPDVIRGVYHALSKLGFTGGNILEPSAGIGNFIGYAPKDILDKSSITAIELDKFTGKILEKLYPSVYTKIKGYQDVKIANGSVDLVISNIPFGDYDVTPNKSDSDIAKRAAGRIHNYFFIKAIEQAREGGLVAFITTAGTLDTPGNEFVRTYIKDNTEFVGAIRLPSTAFKVNAGTEVVTDVIFLKKNTDAKSNQDIINTTEVNVPGGSIGINNYFVNNPDHVIGDIKLDFGLHGRKALVVDYDGNDIGKRINDIVDKYFPKNIYAKRDQESIDAETTKIGEERVDHRISIDKDGAFTYVNNERKSIDMGVEKAKAFIDLRDALDRQYKLESSPTATDGMVEQNRAELNRRYDTFVGVFQKLNSPKNIKHILKDKFGYNVLALERVDKESGKTVKADIFKSRGIVSTRKATKASNISDAVSINYNELGAIDVERIASLLGEDSDGLVERYYGDVFYDSDGTVVGREDYLSGNVKKKYKEALALAEGNDLYQQNVDALAEVLPKDIPIENIDINIGQRWVPLAYYKEFADFIFKTRTKIKYDPITDSYAIDGSKVGEASGSWAIGKMDGFELLIHAMHGSSPAIYMSGPTPGSRVIDPVNTQLANEKVEKLGEEFKSWIATSPERAEVLQGLYNDSFNTNVKRKFSDVFTVNGQSYEVILKEHQKRGANMIVANNGGIIDHMVGAGKTYLIIAAALKMRQLGVANKPMIVGLKSTIQDLASDAKKLFPMAKVLSPSEADFSKENRKKLLSTIQNNDWDLIIISHEQFGAIPQDKEFHKGIIEKEIKEIEAALLALEAESGEAASRKLIQGLTKRKENLRAKLDELADFKKDDELLSFKDIGIDHLFVDESQYFKNLAYTTRINRVSGLGNPLGSKRSYNMLVAARTLQAFHGGDKGVTFVSGTPISNSLVEMYLLLKYLRPKRMQELGYTTFDAWVNQFAIKNRELEFTVAGGIKEKTRFREFVNVPELSLLYNEVADVRNEHNLTIERPSIRGGKPTLVAVKQSEAQQEWTKRIIQFAEQKQGSRDGSLIGKGSLTKEEQSAAMLMVTTIGNKLSNDIRLVDKKAEFNPEGKLVSVANKVIEEYENSKDIKGTQLIFSDIGTPKTGKVFDDILSYLEDEKNIDFDTINLIFGEPNEETGERATKPVKQIRERIKEYLEYSDTEIDFVFEEAKNSSLNSFNTYNEIKRLLIQKGIPDEEIAFIHDYKNKNKRKALFADVNIGKVRVVIGSTQKLGTGVNVQKRIVAMHHVDAKWTPADMEQRNGRGIRQGNINTEVAVFQYGTEQTVDAYKYQLIATKQRFIDQVKSGALDGARTIKEDDGENMTAQEFVALLSGNPLLLEKAKLEALIGKLTRSARAFIGEQSRIRSGIVSNDRAISRQELYIEGRKKDIETASKNMRTDEDGKVVPVWVIDYKQIDDSKVRRELVEEKINSIKDKDIGASVVIGQVAGFNYTARKIEDPSVAQKGGLDFSTIKYELEGKIMVYSTSSVPSNTINSFADNLVKAEKVLADTKKELESYESALKDNWPKEEELAAAKARLAEVVKELTPEKKKEEAVNNEEENAFQETVRTPTPIDAGRFNQLLENLNDAIQGRLGGVLSGKEFDSRVKRMQEIRSGGKVYGFKDAKGKVWINGDEMNGNTPIHEYGHVWIDVMESVRPDIFKKGLEIADKLIYIERLLERKDSVYAKDIAEYKKGNKTGLLKEALAMAIGDHGEQIVNIADKNRFKAWLKAFWNSVKDFFGGKLTDMTPERIQKLTPLEFIELAAGQLVSGDAVEGEMLAPNGKPSNLTPEQYRLVRTPEFKKWFGDSQVKDENGEPLVVYHGTTKYGGVTSFKKGKRGNIGPGIYFTNDKDYAQSYADKYGKGNGHNINVFVKIKNPFYVYGIDGAEALITKLYSKSIYENRARKQSNPNYLVTSADIAKLKSIGYDGIVWAVKEGGEYKEYSVFEPNQIKSAIGNTSFNPESNDIRFQVLPDGRKVQVKPLPDGVEVVNGFYSNTEKALAQIGDVKMTGGKWVSYLLSNGANKEEIQWTLEPYLKDNATKTISKADVQKYLKDNRIQVVEVVKGEVSNFTKDDIADVKINQHGAGNWVVKTKEDGTVEFPLDKADDKAEAIEYALEQLNYDNKSKRESKPKFQQYQLEGEKENYREVLVTMPNDTKGYYALRKEFSDYSANKVPRKSGEDIVAYQDRYKKELENDKDYQALRQRMIDADKKQKEDFKSSHFDEPNILVHLRMSDRIDSEGNKVLHLSEIQSDWGQKGKKEGFNIPAKKNEFRKEKQSDGSWVVKDANNTAWWHGSTEERADAVINEYNTRETRIPKEVGAIPNAPFVTDTNQWVKLGLKTALKYAVKSGATKITWETGETQNARYDLSKQVDEISTKKYPDGTYTIIGYKDGNSVLEHNDVPENKLEEYVGKDLAKKISDKHNEEVSFRKGAIKEFQDFQNELQDSYGKAEVRTLESYLRHPNNENSAESKKYFTLMTEAKKEYEGVNKNDVWNSFSGVDLKVGGKGMKGFYGSPTEGSLGIVGNVAKSLFKQEPKTVVISKGDAEKNIETKTLDELNNANKDNKELWIENKENGNRFTASYTEAKDALSKGYKVGYLDKGKDISTQHSIDITQELIAEVNQGLPQFQETGGREPGYVSLTRKAYVKAQRELAAAEERISRMNVTEYTMFGAPKGGSLFGIKGDDIKDIIGPLKEKLAIAKEAYNKALVKAEVEESASKGQMDLFKKEEQIKRSQAEEELREATEEFKSAWKDMSVSRIVLDPWSDAERVKRVIDSLFRLAVAKGIVLKEDILALVKKQLEGISTYRAGKVAATLETYMKAYNNPELDQKLTDIMTAMGLDIPQAITFMELSYNEEGTNKPEILKYLNDLKAKQAEYDAVNEPIEAKSKADFLNKFMHALYAYKEVDTGFYNVDITGVYSGIETNIISHDKKGSVLHAKQFIDSQHDQFKNEHGGSTTQFIQTISDFLQGNTTPVAETISSAALEFIGQLKKTGSVYTGISYYERLMDTIKEHAAERRRALAIALSQGVGVGNNLFSEKLLKIKQFKEQALDDITDEESDEANHERLEDEANYLRGQADPIRRVAPMDRSVSEKAKKKLTEMPAEEVSALREKVKKCR